MERRAVEALAGRHAELERLEAFALGDEPLVMHIQGIPGIGKTHLLNALAASVGGKGVFVARVDARWCEPAALCALLPHSTSVTRQEVVCAGRLVKDGQKQLFVSADDEFHEFFRRL